MRTIHIGHHFFGAGNAGDDWMMAGFLTALPATQDWRLTCCVPHPLEPLRARFPQVQWLPYEIEVRRRCIAECTAWLGLGGSPFQSAASRWFIDHLAAESRWCAETVTPMYFLGIGGQDPAAYSLPEMRQVLAQAEQIWTRDDRTAEAAVEAGGGGRVSGGADLAHLHFLGTGVPAAAMGRLTAVFNFDYAAMPPRLPAVLAAIAAVQATEKIWAVQEERPLPGAELWLFDQLTAEQRTGWEIIQPHALGAWPSGEWLLSSRYHATLAGAWAGSRAVVIALNEKLRAAADETGFPLFAMDDDPGTLRDLFERSQPVSRTVLGRRAEAAAKACAEFFQALV